MKYNGAHISRKWGGGIGALGDPHRTEQVHKQSSNGSLLGIQTWAQMVHSIKERNAAGTEILHTALNLPHHPGTALPVLKCWLQSPRGLPAVIAHMVCFPEWWQVQGCLYKIRKTKAALLKHNNSLSSQIHSWVIPNKRSQHRGHGALQTTAPPQTFSNVFVKLAPHLSNKWGVCVK